MRFALTVILIVAICVVILALGLYLVSTVEN